MDIKKFQVLAKNFADIHAKMQMARINWSEMSSLMESFLAFSAAEICRKKAEELLKVYNNLQVQYMRENGIQL